MDDKEQVIVACDVTNQSNDVKQLVPLIEQATGNLPEITTQDSVVVTTDSGYSSIGSLKELEEKGYLDAYIPDV